MLPGEFCRNRSSAPKGDPCHALQKTFESVGGAVERRKGLLAGFGFILRPAGPQSFGQMSPMPE